MGEDDKIWKMSVMLTVTWPYVCRGGGKRERGNRWDMHAEGQAAMKRGGVK